MRRQPRAFTVEIRQKRSSQKRSLSIWSDVDLTAAMAETRRELEKMELPNGRPVDSSVVSLNAEHMHKPRAEHLMTNSLDAGSGTTATQPAAKVETPLKKKAQRSPRAKVEPRPPARKNAPNAASQAQQIPAAAVRTGRKIYSENERAQMLALIQKSISGGATHKSAVKQAGISEQTYYQWKRAALPASVGDDLKDLVALEEENKRLKSLLAERLRKENAELKRKLELE
ncbi:MULTISPECIES: transposase [Mesorhizobium]|nr:MULTISPECIES: transposase [Mesorhizobium]